MESDRLERKLAAILSTDAVGFSRLMAQNEVQTITAIESSRVLMNECIRQYGGRVVDSVGDNLLAEFASVVDAVAGAIEIQAQLARRNEGIPSEQQLLFRIGLHLGDVIVRGESLVGDGVNIAARIESMADVGGVSLSGTAFDQVDGRLPIEFEDLGPQTLKNIPRPIRVYRARLDKVGVESHRAAAPATRSVTVPGFSGRSAIAVMAFENLSRDPDQEYFADGIAEDLITRLSACRIFPVIARNSSFAYKGRAIDPRQLRRELGVGYVVPGSVRRGGSRVRIAAQLIETEGGQNVWAERYDRDLDDVFELQDEITETIVASLEPQLARVEQKRAHASDPQSLDAWDRVQAGWWHAGRYTEEDLREAHACARRALELDPSFAPAFVLLGGLHEIDLLYGWGESTSKSLEAALAAGTRAVTLDPEDARAHFVVGMARTFNGEHEAAIVAQERALDLNPSLAVAYWGLGIALGASALHAGEDGSGMITKALRLSPYDPLRPFMLQNLGIAHLLSARYDEAAESALRSIQLQAEQPHGWRLLAASRGHVGRLDEAREALDRAFKLAPNALEDLRMLNRPAVVEAVVEGWRKAGWEG